MRITAYHRLRSFKKRVPKERTAMDRATDSMMKTTLATFATQLDKSLMGPPRHIHDRPGWLADGWVYHQPCEPFFCKGNPLQIGMMPRVFGGLESVVFP